jgi:hypothetical protein
MERVTENTKSRAANNNAVPISVLHDVGGIERHDQQAVRKQVADDKAQQHEPAGEPQIVAPGSGVPSHRIPSPCQAREAKPRNSQYRLPADPDPVRLQGVGWRSFAAAILTSKQKGSGIGRPGGNSRPLSAILKAPFCACLSDRPIDVVEGRTVARWGPDKKINVSRPHASVGEKITPGGRSIGTISGWACGCPSPIPASAAFMKLFSPALTR